MEGLMYKPLLGAFPLSDVAVHDNQSIVHALGALNGACSRFKKAPGTVLVSDAIFQPFTPAGIATLYRSLQYARAVVRMHMIQRGSSCQFFRTISKNFLICRTVIDALSIAVYNRDHVGGIFRN